MNIEEKVLVAKQLARLNVDIIEAGFAFSSPGDFEAIRRIRQEVEGPVVSGARGSGCSRQPGASAAEPLLLTRPAISD